MSRKAEPPKTRPVGRPRLVPPPPADAKPRTLPLNDAEWLSVLQHVTRLRTPPRATKLAR